jgi:hypothetical protein
VHTRSPSWPGADSESEVLGPQASNVVPVSASGFNSTQLKGRHRNLKISRRRTWHGTDCHSITGTGSQSRGTTTIEVGTLVYKVRK